jgi:hypothetical protein
MSSIFYRAKLGGRNYFILSTENNSHRLYIPCDKPEYSDLYDYYNIRDEDDEYQIPTEGQEITEYCNNLLLKLLGSYGVEYDPDKNFMKRVVYTWDQNLIPGEKFIGLKLMGLEGTEENIVDLFPKITMNLDVLDCFRFDWNGYRGLKGNYRLYLPYTEDNIEIYRDYLRMHIDKRFPPELERKIKI